MPHTDTLHQQIPLQTAVKLLANSQLPPTQRTAFIWYKLPPLVYYYILLPLPPRSSLQPEGCRVHPGPPAPRWKKHVAPSTLHSISGDHDEARPQLKLQPYFFLSFLFSCLLPSLPYSTHPPSSGIPEPFPLPIPFFFFWGGVFSGLHLRHMEVPRLGVESELPLLPYTTATAMQDPSHTVRPNLNPLSKARDGT